MFLAFMVEGNPVPQGSFRHIGQGRIISANPKLNAWRQTISNQIAQETDVRLIEAPISLNLMFVLPRPKTVTRDQPTVKPDLDKLIRSVCDAISLERYVQLIKDDSQIIKIQASKRYESAAFKPGVQITLFWDL